MNPHMWVLLQDKAKNLDLACKPCACIGLEDDRFRIEASCGPKSCRQCRHEAEQEGNDHWKECAQNGV